MDFHILSSMSLIFFFSFFPSVQVSVPLCTCPFHSLVPNGSHCPYSPGELILKKELAKMSLLGYSLINASLTLMSLIQTTYLCAPAHF